jgi:hypothetical protein
VQVKYTESDGKVVAVRCYSVSLTNGKVKQKKHYTAATIDCIAVYDKTTDRCYYVSASALGEGRSLVSLRVAPAANNQRVGVHPAENYLHPPERKIVRLPLVRIEPSTTLFREEFLEVEPAGFEPAASSVQGKRSAN